LTELITLVADRILTGYEDWTPGWVTIEGEIIIAVGPGMPAVDMESTTIGGTVVPGFVDLHAHGAVGIDFGAATSRDARTVSDYHVKQGTTTMLASLASAWPSEMQAAVMLLRDVASDGTIAGIHLEGPFLSPRRSGAHKPELLRLPSLMETETLLEIGEGSIRVVTIAPELPGAEEIVRFLVSAGVCVAIGHSDCDASTAYESFSWGVSLVTHLYNGMPEFEHRNPGLVGAALIDDRVTVELICDGQHISREAIEVARRCAPDRYALVSDAMQATGQPDGLYSIAGSVVRVDGGKAMLADGSSLAGSTKTVAEGLSRLLELDGVTLQEAVRATSITPASVLGIAKAGIQTGAYADLVVLNKADMNPTRVMKRGTWAT